MVLQDSRWYYPGPSLVGERVRIHRCAWAEPMVPSIVDRTEGTGDVLLMYFHDPVVIDRADRPAASLRCWAEGDGHRYGNLAGPWRHSWVHCSGELADRLARRLPAVLQPPEPEPPSLEQQVATLQDKLIRAQAEFDNSRKRLEREKWDAVRYANESLLESLLPVIDNFQLGLQAAEQGGDAKSIALGMEMVKNQLGQFLHDHEVREVDAAPGKPFDHNIHEALRQEPHDDIEAGHIVFCQRKGYHLRERLLRPALLVVAEKPGETKDTSD